MLSVMHCGQQESSHQFDAVGLHVFKNFKRTEHHTGRQANRHTDGRKDTHRQVDRQTQNIHTKNPAQVKLTYLYWWSSTAVGWPWTPNHKTTPQRSGQTQENTLPIHVDTHRSKRYGVPGIWKCSPQWHCFMSSTARWSSSQKWLQKIS